MTGRRPRVLVFSEARYEVDSAGTFYAENATLSVNEWKRDLPPTLDPVLVARAAVTEEPAGEALVGEAIALPYYVGVWRAASRLIAVWRSIDQGMEGADLALVKVPGVIGAMAALSAHRHGVPVAAQVVGDAAGVLRSGATGRLLRLFSPAIEMITRSTVRRGQAVRYVTVAYLQRKYPANPLAAVHSFSDVSISDHPQWRQGDLTVPRLVAVGSLDQLYKGHHHLLMALRSVRKSIPDATLTIVGSGRYMPYLRDLATELGVASAVRFCGHISKTDMLREILASATLFVLPSLTEGMPRALIEAMAVGTPSIGTRVGGVPELLSTSETFNAGDIDRLSDLIIGLHRDPVRLRKLSLVGVSATRRYTEAARAASSIKWQASLLQLAMAHRSREP